VASLGTDAEQGPREATTSAEKSIRALTPTSLASTALQERRQAWVLSGRAAAAKPATVAEAGVQALDTRIDRDLDAGSIGFARGRSLLSGALGSRLSAAHQPGPRGPMPGGAIVDARPAARRRCRMRRQPGSKRSESAARGDAFRGQR
jgi:hypothetical protein